MADQREKPGPNRERLEAATGATVTHISGGMIENFREGWALHIMTGPGKVAHWFRRDGFGAAESLCHLTAPVRWLYGRGNFPCCKHCVRLRERMASAAIVRPAA